MKKVTCFSLPLVEEDGEGFVAQESFVLSSYIESNKYGEPEAK